MMTSRRHDRRAHALAVACLLGLSAGAGCYTNYYIYGAPDDAETVQVHVPSPVPNYLSYQTFSFNDPGVEIPAEMVLYEDVIRDELIENMRHRGFIYDPEAPDFVFNLYADSEPGSTSFSGHYCDGATAYAYHYPCDYYEAISLGGGSLIVGLVEADEERDLWTAVIEGVFVEGVPEETITQRIRNNLDVAFDLSPAGLRDGPG